MGVDERKQLKKNAKDITGNRYGKLTALRPTDERKKGSVVWECQCDCGNLYRTSVILLNGGQKTSCGCLSKEKPRRFVDITGERFGKLVAIKPTGETDASGYIWECQCDCGSIVYYSNGRLKHNGVKSCGCLSAMAATNLSGQRFGRLTAIKPTTERRHRAVVWECICDCGKTTYVTTQNLTSGGTKSCGCLNADIKRKTIKDLSGMKFGKLTVIKATDLRDNGRVVWECKCDCGNEALVIGTNLKSGSTRSCGCLRKGGRVYGTHTDIIHE